MNQIDRNLSPCALTNNFIVNGILFNWKLTIQKKLFVINDISYASLWARNKKKKLGAKKYQYTLSLNWIYPIRFQCFRFFENGWIEYPSCFFTFLRLKSFPLLHSHHINIVIKSLIHSSVFINRSFFPTTITYGSCGAL